MAVWPDTTECKAIMETVFRGLAMGLDPLDHAEHHTLEATRNLSCDIKLRGGMFMDIPICSRDEIGLSLELISRM